MKFGGTSVADAERLKRAARRIVAQRERGKRVVAVLSARGQTTDELIAMADEVSPSPDPREMDLLLATHNTPHESHRDAERRRTGGARSAGKTRSRAQGR